MDSVEDEASGTPGKGVDAVSAAADELALALATEEAAAVAVLCSRRKRNAHARPVITVRYALADTVDTLEFRATGTARFAFFGSGDTLGW